ncbi:hypothetical protein [Alicyclobacillus sp. ALC3]|uniref:hypothetical protein n=1 Tax=Alicyclobacillus sp. ALC3 TaxID=2796143 RepID=UPI002379554A|nr:hypothetical protein [Alicyclobacillus sp. ALC3]WDL97218.1 hypothetical protein JC200_00175 [Alicyclobacillus sp. ALC3]
MSLLGFRWSVSVTSICATLSHSIRCIESTSPRIHANSATCSASGTFGSALMQLQQVDPLHAKAAQTQFNLLPGSSGSGAVVGAIPSDKRGLDSTRARLST